MSPEDHQEGSPTRLPWVECRCAAPELLELSGDEALSYSEHLECEREDAGDRTDSQDRAVG